VKLCYFAIADSTHTHRWLEAFVDRGHDVHLVAAVRFDGRREVRVHPFPGAADHDLRLRRVPGARGVERLLRSIPKLRRLVRTIDPDVVHAHYVSWGHAAFLSGGRPLVVTAWGSDVYHYRHQPLLSRVLTRLTLSRADLVTCDSEDLRRAVIAVGARADRTDIVHFGVDVESFRPPRDRMAARRKLGLAADEAVVLSIRSLRETYNIDTIVQAFARLAPRFSRLRLVLKDYMPDPAYRRAILAQIDAAGLRDRVTVAGFVAYGAMADFYGAADVVVSLATTDSSPLSVLEAMACGALVVASDIPGLHEWVVEGDNGFLADPRDVADVADKIERALTLPAEVRSRYVERSRDLVVSRASHARHMDRVEQIYARLAADARRRSATVSSR
jgi:glycosyltransferase involved in cell wall biosynthesis